MIQEWEKIGNTEIVQSLAQTLLNLLLHANGVPFSVERKLAGIVALIVKHQYVTQNGHQREQLVAHLQSVFTNGASGHLVVSEYNI